MSGERVEDFPMKIEDAGREFRRGLEDLVRGHIDGCMTALASCSAGSTDEEDEPGFTAGDGVDQLVRRRRRSDLEGDDIAESSAAARRHSRILSRWVARQAEEMITTIERRNRESELMALAGLHTVSMLDSSFLRESRRSQSSAERPVAARASSILQRWRELEVQAAARDRRSTRRGAAGSGFRHARESQVSQTDDSEFSQWARGSFHAVNIRYDVDLGDEDGRQSSREQSSDLWDVERERVRQIARGWMNESGIADDSLRVSPRNETPRAEWLGETERERVRLAREWVQMNSQQRQSLDSGREGRESEREESVTDHEDGQPENVRRHLLRIRGRQASLDPLMRIVRDRQRELQGLSEHRAVSDFAQSFQRGRFLLSGRPQEYARPPSVAASELGQLRQQHFVSGLREGFHFVLEDIVGAQTSLQAEGRDSELPVSTNDQMNDGQLNDMVELTSLNQEHLQSVTENYEIHQTLEMHSTAEVENIDTTNNMNLQTFMAEIDNWREQNVQHMAENRQQSAEPEFTAWLGRSGEEESDGIWHDQIDHEWPTEAPEDVDGEGLVLEAPEWHVDDSHETIENRKNRPSEAPREPRLISSRQVNRFLPSDDDNVYSMELRELLSRRIVSTLLRSGFGENLDQLIQSYVQRQGHSPLGWDEQRPLSTPALPESQGRQRDATNQERDAISGLKADVARLEQGMSLMQRMLEVCIDMQLELQRSGKQEISAALNCGQVKF